MESSKRGPSKSLVFMLTAPLTACSGGQMITSNPIAEVDVTKPLQGVPYYLPKALIPITITGGSAKDAAGKGSDTGAPSQTSTPATPTSGSTGSGTTPAQTNTATATANPQVSVTVKSGDASNDGSAGDGSGTPPIYKLAVTAGKPQFVADTSQEYFLSYTPEAWADDTLGLHVDSGGLLQSAKGQTTDQTGAVGAALVQLAATIVKAAGGAVGLAVDTSQRKCALPSITKSFTYDPSAKDLQDDGSELSRYATAPNAGQIWEIASNGDDKINGHQTVSLRINSKSNTSELAPPPAKDPKKSAGILFRNWVEWTISVEVTASPDAAELCQIRPMQHSFKILIPNQGTEFWEDMSREPLISKQLSLTVQNGMLMGIDVTRPSFALAVVKLPLEIIQPIVSLPFNALTSGLSPTSSSAGATSTAAKTSGN